MGDKLARNPVWSPFLRFHVINCDPLRAVGSLDQLKVLRTKIDEDIREFGGFISRRKRQTQAYLQKTTMSVYIYIYGNMEVSRNTGTSKSSISRWDFPLYTIHFVVPPFYGNPHIVFLMLLDTMTMSIAETFINCCKWMLKRKKCQHSLIFYGFVPTFSRGAGWFCYPWGYNILILMACLEISGEPFRPV